MEQICSLLNGADEPIQGSYDEFNYEEEDEEESIEEIFSDDITLTNGDNIIRTLPQPPEHMTNPLCIDINPVSILPNYYIFIKCKLVLATMGSAC